MAQLRKDAGPAALPTDLYGNAIFVVMRSKLPPEQVENAIRSVVHRIDPQLALTLMRTMDEVVAESEAPRRFNTVVIASFALAAVLLAVLGIYSVIAFSVASRVQEMAIRMALGSQRSDILRLILIAGLKLAAMGCAAGTGGSGGGVADDAGVSVWGEPVRSAGDDIGGGGGVCAGAGGVGVAGAARGERGSAAGAAGRVKCAASRGGLSLDLAACSPYLQPENV